MPFDPLTPPLFHQSVLAFISPIYSPSSPLSTPLAPSPHTLFTPLSSPLTAPLSIKVWGACRMYSL